MDKQFKILMADDHPMFMDGLKAVLRREKWLDFVGEVIDGEMALNFIKSNEVDLLITDIAMPKISGVELVKTIKHIKPEVKILVVSMHGEKEIVADIMLSEAEGYILKNASKDELVAAIIEISQGGYHYSKDVMTAMLQRVKKNVVQDFAVQKLTQREQEILHLIMQEYSTQEVANALFISPRTVETHRKNIMLKTNSKTIIGLVKYVFANGLTFPSPY